MDPEQKTQVDQTFTTQAKEKTSRGLRKHHANEPPKRTFGPALSIAYRLGIDHKNLLRSGRSIDHDTLAQIALEHNTPITQIKNYIGTTAKELVLPTDLTPSNAYEETKDDYTEPEQHDKPLTTYTCSLEWSI